MTCRIEVLDSFDKLHTSSGRVEFSPAEVLAHMRQAGSTYADSTIRTHVTAHMLGDGTLVRCAPARYRLARHADRVEPPTPVDVHERPDRITEDAVKAAVKAWLEADGWNVEVRWGRERGVDIEATRGTERWLIEAKGEAPAGPQQVNYFLGAIGELVQRMDNDNARYGLALPDHRQYRGLVNRLPITARRRLALDVFFVNNAGEVNLDSVS